ncbi:MAG: hypothetical protein RL689_2334, partial [Planctomycetota bacterium]
MSAGRVGGIPRSVAPTYRWPVKTDAVIEPREVSAAAA